MATVASMTGFASLQSTSPLGLVALELRCVNSRFLDLTVRLPEELRACEGAVQALIKKRVARGKFELRINLKRVDSTPSIDEDALRRLTALENQVLSIQPSAKPLSVSQILAYPGVVNASHVEPQAIEQSILSALDQALDAFTASREREGAALTKVLLGYCDQIDAEVKAIAQKLPLILDNLKTKLTERLTEALTQTLSENSSLSPEDVNDRIRQEVTLYALKMDVDEEMNRLLTHVKEVRRVLDAGGAVGRRLDFLMQEMNREANTLGSKAAAIEMTQTSLNLKLVIEQMREQLQNLE